MRSNEDTKEDVMLRLLLSLNPANLLHELGTGRALDNARRDHIERTLTLAEVDAIIGRIPPVAHERRDVTTRSAA
jgi:hypothetical protein